MKSAMKFASRPSAPVRPCSTSTRVLKNGTGIVFRKRTSFQRIVDVVHALQLGRGIALLAVVQIVARDAHPEIARLVETEAECVIGRASHSLAPA